MLLNGQILGAGSWPVNRYTNLSEKDRRRLALSCPTFLPHIQIENYNLRSIMHGGSLTGFPGSHNTGDYYGQGMNRTQTT